MSSSMLTQYALANSLKKFMLTIPINRIHVRMLTDDCGLTRHTFYNHFRDVYDLLGWVYDREVVDGLDQYCTREKWPQGIELVLQYTAQNRVICLNTFRSLGRDHLEGFLYRVFYQLIRNVVDDIARKMRLSEENKQECCGFYANALVGVFIAWLKDDLRESPEHMADLIDRIMSGNIVHSLEKYDAKAKSRG